MSFLIKIIIIIIVIIIIITIIIFITIILDSLGLNINWDIVLFSAPVADVTFLFFASYF